MPTDFEKSMFEQMISQSMQDFIDRNPERAKNLAKKVVIKNNDCKNCDNRKECIVYGLATGTHSTTKAVHCN